MFWTHCNLSALRSFDGLAASSSETEYSRVNSYFCHAADTTGENIARTRYRRKSISSKIEIATNAAVATLIPPESQIQYKNYSLQDRTTRIVRQSVTLSH
jgi:hypothetical protein